MILSCWMMSHHRSAARKCRGQSRTVSPAAMMISAAMTVLMAVSMPILMMMMMLTVSVTMILTTISTMISMENLRKSACP